MIAELFKRNLSRSLVSSFVTEDQVEALIRPLLERYGVAAAEIDALVAEARANVRKWKDTSAPTVSAAVSAGTAALRTALGAPARADIDALRRRIDELSRRPGRGGEPR